MVSEPRVFILAHPVARRRAQEFIGQAPDGWTVECKPPRRNSAINAALHAMLSDIAARMPWAGQKRDITTWKRLLTAAWLRARGEQVELLPAIDGKGVDVVFERTSQMSQAEVRELLTFVEAWAAEQPELQEQEA